MHKMFTGKKILIIGGTGTIGLHLLKQLLEQNPKVIRIFSRDEYKQFELQQKLGEVSNIRYFIGDVRDYQRLARAMEDVDYVFHSAAMKHVPSCEYNPFEAVQTNVIGTQNVIQAALHSGVSRVLFTSTDKAIAPTNTYGATKLTAERLISAAEYQKGDKKTVFLSVRFGNVMGSRGSVIPLFKQQIIESNIVTITDPNMLRFMMTPSQAISLMLKAMEIAQGGEVFVLKMPVIKLLDLAHVMIEEVANKYNLTTETDIHTIGLRPGEKMYEELMTNEEYRIALEANDMYIIPPTFSSGEKYYSNTWKATQIQNPLEHESLISKETLRDWILAESLI